MSRIARAAAVAAAIWIAVGGPAARAQPASVAADACAEAGAPAWKALEAGGGVVPEIDEDRTQAPPAWWRYPGPRRSAEILAAEAKAPDGLYERVAPDDLKEGDVIVRATGAGACGKMAVVAGQLEGRWMLQDATEKDGASKASDDALFVGGARLRPEAVAYRIRVKADTTQGHIRELQRDIAHLERTIAERPALVAPKGLLAVKSKVQDLVDEAWSLGVDPTADLPRRELTGRALALAAALDDWPGAAESAAAVLDDVLARAPDQPDTVLARASLFLLGGQPERALPLAQKAVGLPRASTRARYVLARALLASGKQAEGMAALRRYLTDEPGDPRANQLAASAGKKPALGPVPEPDADLRFSATPEHVGATSATYGFRVDWPIPWRIFELLHGPDAGVLLYFITGRVFDDEGAAGRGTVMLTAHRPRSAAERAALKKLVADEVVGNAKVKPLPPLVAGSQHQSMRTKVPGEGTRLGELTTIERSGVVYVIVLQAPPGVYPKLKDQYADFVRSLSFTRE
jgi:tetratricopeptide (TPR) repeat protein